MRYLKTSEAAALLNVSPNTLRAWERRFGFPKPQRSPGKHRLFTHGEVAALRDALQEGLSISSAVSRAREGLAADSNSLVGALVSYERERADHGDRGRAGPALGRAVRGGGPAAHARGDRPPPRPRVGRVGVRVALGRRTGCAGHRGSPPRRCARSRSSSAMRPATSSIPTRLTSARWSCSVPARGVNVLSLSARGVTRDRRRGSIHRPNLVVVAGEPPGRRHDGPLGLRDPARRRGDADRDLSPRRAAGARCAPPGTRAAARGRGRGPARGSSRWSRTTAGCRWSIPVTREALARSASL